MLKNVRLRLKWFFHKHILGFGYESFEVLKTKGCLQLFYVLQKGFENTKTEIEGLGLKLHLKLRFKIEKFLLLRFSFEPCSCKQKLVTNN